MAAALIAPLFRARYMDNWGSIDSTFISDARFLVERCRILAGSQTGI